MEVWKPIPGFDQYEASNEGRIRRIPGRGCRGYRVLRPSTTPLGYKRLVLCVEGQYFDRYVHRLVLSAFLGESELECNHKDGDKANNGLINLEYCTKSENHLHASRLGLKNALKGEAHKCAKIRTDQVYEIRASNKSLSKLAAIYGVSQSAIHRIKRRQSWKHLPEEVK